MATKEISKSTLKRLPIYLSYLKGIPADGSEYISATALAAALDMGSTVSSALACFWASSAYASGVLAPSI